MSSPNADLIAVSLACPKDPTSPYRMGPPRESSVRNLLEKVGNLRDIAVLVQLNLAFLTFIDLHLCSQIVSDYQPLFSNGFFEFEIIIIFGCRCGPVFSKSSRFVPPRKILTVSRGSECQIYQWKSSYHNEDKKKLYK